MCGIFGFTFRNDKPHGMLKKMGESLRHRGPDDDGYYHDKIVSLGMNRLSIIDLEHGKQPFLNRKNTVVVFCNGEIFNYIELRKELVRRGYRFETQSDIEVLPHLYDEYGIDFIEKLNGMYTICLYDKEKEEIFLIRDRLGIKPLYYAIVDTDLIFASELKSILATNYVSETINFDALSTYLELLYIPTPLSPFRDVYKLSSGTYLRWSNGKHKLESYWEPKLEIETIIDEESAIEQINDILTDSLRLQMRSDVPVGTFLSGGIDSSAISALAAIQTDESLNTFHIHWNGIEGKLDESKQAALVSQRYGTKHFVKDVSDEDLIRDLPKLVWHLDEPLADGAFLLTYGLAKEAAKHVKVILSGAGGDELFGGYRHYKKHSFIANLASKILFDKDVTGSYFDKRKTRDSKKWKKYFDWFRPSVYASEMNEIYTRNRSEDMLNATMLSDLKWYLQDDILMLTDKMTMAASIECRVPLLDYRLVELSLGIGSDLKICNGEKKYIFKKAMAKHLPPEVLDRPKEGFGAPIRLWVNRYKKKYFDKVLQEGVLLREGLVESSQLELLIKNQELSDDEAWKYWKMLILDLWMQLFLDKRDYGSFF